LENTSLAHLGLRDLKGLLRVLNAIVVHAKYNHHTLGKAVSCDLIKDEQNLFVAVCVQFPSKPF